MKTAQTVEFLTGKKDKQGNPIIETVDIDYFSDMPMPVYQSLKPSFTNTRAHTYYDSFLIKAGQPLLLGKNARLFDKGQGEVCKYINYPTSTYEKTEFHTNMRQEGQFDNQTSFILEQISVEIELSTDPPATVNGQIQAPATTTVANYSAVNHLLALRNAFKLVYNWGDQPLYEGRFKEFPDPFTMSGAIGASTGGFVQNGFGLPAGNKLPSPEVLKSSDRFSIDCITLMDTFTPLVDVRVVVSMIGSRIRAYR